ncbi:MAG TPA: hypothetical protein VMA86_03330 [Acetobacteraceae bacterium]|nr:hypothetical protein [Acetobacteraceae bacterium]
MNVIPFVAAAYVAGVLVPVVLAFSAWTRLRRAERRLAAIDPRAGRRR